MTTLARLSVKFCIRLAEYSFGRLFIGGSHRGIKEEKRELAATRVSQWLLILTSKEVAFVLEQQSLNAPIPLKTFEQRTKKNWNSFSLLVVTKRVFWLPLNKLTVMGRHWFALEVKQAQTEARGPKVELDVSKAQAWAHPGRGSWMFSELQPISKA